MDAMRQLILRLYFYLSLNQYLQSVVIDASLDNGIHFLLKANL